MNWTNNNRQNNKSNNNIICSCHSIRSPNNNIIKSHWNSWNNQPDGDFSGVTEAVHKIFDKESIRVYKYFDQLSHQKDAQA